MYPTHTSTSTKVKPKNGFGFFDDEFESALDSHPAPSYEANAFYETSQKEGKFSGEKGTLFTFNETSNVSEQKQTIEFTPTEVSNPNTKTVEQKSPIAQPLAENLSAALGVTAGAATEISKQTLKITRMTVKDTLSAVWDLLEMFTGKSFLKKKESKPKSPETPQEQAKQQEIAEKKFVQQRLQETEAAKNQASASSTQELLKQALMIDVGPMNSGDAKSLNLSLSLSGEHITNRYHLMNKARKMDEAIDNQKKAEMGAGVGSKGPDLSLNKVAEGGSMMSSTGGAGAG